MTKTDIPVPTNIPASDEAETAIFNYDQWRNSFLNIVLWVVCGLSIFLILPNIPTISLGELIALGLVYLSLLFVTIVPLPYQVKAGAIILAGYFASLYTLIRFGPWSDSSLFFLTTMLLAALLFDNSVDRWVLIANTISIAIATILNITGRFNITESGLPQANISIWLTYNIDHLVLAVVILWAIHLLKIEFRKIAGQFQDALSFVNKNRDELEQHVRDRTTILTKKSEQLRAISYITQQTAEAQSLETVLDLVVNLVTDQFGFYHAGIFLMNESESEVILQAASSDGGKQLVQKGHSFKVGEKSIVGYTAEQKKTRIALDVGADAVFFNNPDLPETHSEIALPLTILGKTLGVIDIQSTQPQAFSIDDIDVLQTLADQVAVAIENMRVLEEAQTALMQIETLTTFRTREAWDQKIKDGGLTYTFTPLGMNTGKPSKDSEHALNIPINLHNQKIGTISLTRKDNVPWSTVDVEMVNEVAHQTGLAVDTVRLVEEATERARQEQTVGELATRFSQTTDIDSLLQTAVRELGQVADVAEVSVYISGGNLEKAQTKNRTKRASD